MSTEALPHLPRKPRRGESLELLIERFTYKGVGAATYEALIGPQKTHRRFTVLVRKAVPGDRVLVDIEKVRKSQINARITELLEPSPTRETPRCQHFGRREEANKGCGGCAVQSVGYQTQLEFKTEVTRRFLRNAGVDDSIVASIIGCDTPWFYRNKMEFSVGDNPSHAFAIGMHPSGYKHDVIAMQECFLESEFSASLVRALSAWFQERGVTPYHPRRNEGFLRTLTVREGKRTGERMVELTTTSEPLVSVNGALIDARELAESFADFVLEFAQGIDGEEVTSIYWTQHHAKRGERTRFIEHHMRGAETLCEQMNLPGGRELRFDIHPRAFFQPNTLQAERLYTEVLERTGLLDHEGRFPGVVLDLYCGTGTIGLCMAPYAERVLGIELNAEAVENARHNARENAIDSVEFFVGDVGEVLGSDEFIAARGSEAVDLVVVDPPRAGLMPKALEHLEQIGAKRMVYVSCNPKALGRDLAKLQGLYELVSVQPVDMFPQTYHVENVALLIKREEPVAL